MQKKDRIETNCMKNEETDCEPISVESNDDYGDDMILILNNYRNPFGCNKNDASLMIQWDCSG